MTPENRDAEMLRRRGVKDPCLVCEGYGVRYYSSGSTWQGGMGTAMGERDVCDSCWGSGDRYRQGADLRRLRDEEARRVADRALGLIAESVGASLGSTRSAVSHIINVLQKLADKRGTPAALWLPEMALGLANTLRRGLGLGEVVR